MAIQTKHRPLSTLARCVITLDWERAGRRISPLCYFSSSGLHSQSSRQTSSSSLYTVVTPQPVYSHTPRGTLTFDLWWFFMKRVTLRWKLGKKNTLKQICLKKTTERYKVIACSSTNAYLASPFMQSDSHTHTSASQTFTVWGRTCSENTRGSLCAGFLQHTTKLFCAVKNCDLNVTKS